MTIYFYKAGDPYGCFSNFSTHGFELDGKKWRTSEHYFQANKYTDDDDIEYVRESKTPGESFKRGRERGRSFRDDWESEKENVMRRALRAKFDAHASCREELLSTGEEEIVEKTRGDYYWGCGTDGGGKNRLGILLMELREQYREEDA